MFNKTFHATHPDMMESVTNDDLRTRYLVQGMFADGEINLIYSHNERFVIGGVVPKGGAIQLPAQTEPGERQGPPVSRTPGDGGSEHRRPRRDHRRWRASGDENQGMPLHSDGLGGRALRRRRRAVLSRLAPPRTRSVP